MSRLNGISCIVLAALIGVGMTEPLSAQTPLGSEFSYQGLLTQGGTPFTGSVTIEFKLYGQELGGLALGSHDFGSQEIEDGVLSFCPDFGFGKFDGDERWLELWINGTAQVPLIPIKPAPYALFALDAPASAGHSLDASDGSPADALVVDADGDVGIGTSVPAAKTHIATTNLSIPASATDIDTLVVEAPDATLGLFSNASGGYGSAVAFREVTAGALVDTWGIVRRTSGAVNPSLRITYGTDRNPAGNATLMTVTPGGVVQSTTGGFMFPDGTTQTTAATGNSGPWSINGSNVYYNAGNVGIGASSPSANLHISRSGTASMQITGSSLSPPFPSHSLLISAAPVAVGPLTAGVTMDTPNDSDLTFKTNGQTRLTLDNAGELTVGRAGTPAGGDGILSLNDDASITSIRLHADGHDNAGSISLYAPDGTTETVAIRGAEGAAEGGEIELRNTSGARTIQLDAQVSSGSGVVALYSPTGLEAVRIDANESAEGGGADITLYNADDLRTVEIDAHASDGEGWLGLYTPGMTDPAIELDPSALDSAAAISIRHNNGNATVVLKASEGNDGGQIVVRNAAGDSTIILDGEHGGVGGEGRITTGVLEITGADLAEKFPVTDPVEPGMVVEIDADQSGQLKLCRGAYNRRVAGVISGANGHSVGAVLGNLPGHENAPPVALSGRVWVYCDAAGAAIEPGDLLTTSDTPGHAMKATDYPRAQGAMIGKAMSRLETGRGMVLVLVSLQ